MTPSDISQRIPHRVSFKHVLYSEILSVTTTMRKNSRWASSALFTGGRDSPALGSNLGLRISSPSQHIIGTENRGNDLLTGFLELKRALLHIEDVSKIELTTLLAPFFAVLRSPLSTGPITSAALSSLHTFFTCELIRPSSPSLKPALVELSRAVSHCKFEASDSSGDEVVLLKIMTVIHDCLCGSVGAELGDIEVCEMLETVLTTCCQMRLSEILRRSAENTMHSLVRTVFAKLCTLDPIVEEAKLVLSDADTADGELKLTVSTNEIPNSNEEDTGSEDVVEKPVEDQELLGIESTGPDEERHAFGLPSILELLRVLINVIDPNDQQHTDSTRLIALGILNAAFEESGTTIAEFPSLRALVVDSGCKFLFQLARSENLSVLHSALRTISTIFDSMRNHLKMQQELFLAFTIDRLASPTFQQINKAMVNAGNSSAGKKMVNIASPIPGTPPPLPLDATQNSDKGLTSTPRILVPPARGETRDLILETLSNISRHPSFMVDLYMNYDCDINCENLFERLIEFLTKAVYLSQPFEGLDIQQRNTLYICLEILLSFVNDMTTRVESAQPWPTDLPSSESLLQTKSQKQLILTGAARFNSKPKTGVAFLEENNLVTAEPSKAYSLAAFLKNCTRIDKRLLGDYISKPENLDILKAFIGLFDFKNKPIAEAMRELLEAFRLPGEAQQIARITETFASIYFSSEPDEIKSEDAVYVLAYSVIMLNTDLHNPQIRKRMSIEDYQRNLRGVNNGSDFSPEFLHNIYDSIRKREIVMPEEHSGQVGFEYAWKELLTRSRHAGDFVICNTSAFDVEMFKATWKPVISAIAYAFISFEDDYIIQRAIAGFRQCATLAGHFNLPDVFDFVVVSLSQATSLLSDALPAQVPNYPVIEVEGKSITVSKLSVDFGTNFKGQLAAVVLFNIVNGNGNALREGWTQIFEMFQNLFLHSLLPIRMLQMEDFLAGVTMIPLRGSQPNRSQIRNDGGLLSALSSYLMTPYGNSADMLVPDASESDVENTLCTIDCITSCRLDELYSQIIRLDINAMVAAVRALEALAHERTVARLKLQPDDVNSEDHPYQLPYDPASVFLLETMVSISCQAPQFIEDLWPIVFEHLSAVLSGSTQYSVLLIERAVVSLLRLCRILAQQASMRDQIYLSFDLLASLPSSVAESVGEQVVAGVILMVQKHGDMISSQTEWNLVFALIKSTMTHTEAARLSFDLISSLVSDGPEQRITIDNFASLVTLLDDFATAAGQSAETHRQKTRRVDTNPNASSLPIIDRGKAAIDLLSNLHRRLISLTRPTSMSTDQAWRQLALPLLTSLGRQSANAVRDIRHNSIGQLQRILLSPTVLAEVEQNQVEDVFNRVIFPLLDELLKPQVYQRDPQGIPETRLRGSALLCKVFMHLEVRETNLEADFRILWIQILDLLDRLMNINKGDQLSEAIPESLKNVLLVMNAVGILVPPSANNAEQQKTLWTATHERMERFLPGFLTELIPPLPTAEPALS